MPLADVPKLAIANARSQLGKIHSSGATSPFSNDISMGLAGLVRFLTRVRNLSISKST